MRLVCCQHDGMRWICTHRPADAAEGLAAFLEVEAPTSELALEEAAARVPSGHVIVSLQPR